MMKCGERFIINNVPYVIKKSPYDGKYHLRVIHSKTIWGEEWEESIGTFPAVKCAYYYAQSHSNLAPKN